MLKAYKYELFPNTTQRKELSSALGSCRYIYNLSLQKKVEAYKSGNSYSKYDLMKQLTILKKELKWLNEPCAQSLQQAIIDLDKAFINFFKHGAGFPKFKKKSNHQSFRIPVAVKIDFDKSKVQIPKVGYVPLNISRIFSGQVRQATVSKTPTKRYFISILVETGTSAPKLKPILNETSIGIDLGIKHFAVLSNGRKIDNPRNLVKSLKKLRIAQRSLARKKKGSKRREQQRIKVARIHERVTNQRKDFLHKLSTEITNQYDSICIENLNVSGMLKNGKLAKHISDASWGSFETMLKYKATWYGKNILQIGMFEPSSKMCSCGTINKELKLSQREWTCSSCGKTHDRDTLAANNIKEIGLRTPPSIRQREAIACA